MKNPYCRLMKVNCNDPEKTAIAEAVTQLKIGHIIAFPTDTYYAIGCRIFDSTAIDRLYRLKDVDKSHNMSIILPDLTDIKRYADIDASMYKIIKRLLPGPYTLVLRATSYVPKIFQSERNTVGIRVPNHAVISALTQVLREPIVSTSAKVRDKVLRLPEDIHEHFGHGLTLILDGGPLTQEHSSIVDLSGPYPTVIRKGAGDVSSFCV